MTSPSSTATERTRRFLTDWFDQLEATGFDGGVFLGALSDDLVWTATGNSPVSGTFRGKQAYIDGVWRPLDDHLETWPKAEVQRILADGEWAVVEFHGVGGVGKNGTDYTLQYCWVVRVVEDRIVEVVGYYDQVKVGELFG
jgi:uncharacterized protein